MKIPSASRIDNHMIIAGTHKIVENKSIVVETPGPVLFLYDRRKEAVAEGRAVIKQVCLESVGLSFSAAHKREEISDIRMCLTKTDEINCGHGHAIMEYCDKKPPTLRRHSPKTPSANVSAKFCKNGQIVHSAPAHMKPRIFPIIIGFVMIFLRIIKISIKLNFSS